ncbi:hypothetical protein AXG93_4773s1200 [Marchantia polymorpha subsp. ruderalis]|uniref:Uncharacterized protein n=1 Tax=Marchantia polymorpha subsp. ruderalis TaxID=1480154 RepID=A0A176WJ37_MARPO|nr:hypothetical protein AXG93_4773s1200 [Marchantia polymorpha subsp. ruderalis]
MIRGCPESWTIEQWAQVLGLCVNQKRLQAKIFGLRTNELRGVREEIKKSSKVTPLEQFAATVGKTITEKSTLPSCQVSSDTVEFDRGKRPLVCEPKSAEFSLLDLLIERIVPLVK